MDNKLTNLYRLQKLGGYFEDSSFDFSPRNNWEQVEAAIRMTTGKVRASSIVSGTPATECNIFEEKLKKLREKEKLLRKIKGRTDLGEYYNHRSVVKFEDKGTIVDKHNK